MKIKDIYLKFSIVIIMLSMALACQQESGPLLSMQEETASLTLEFNMTSQLLTRSAENENLCIDYIIEDGNVTAYETTYADPQTKAGDGNPLDGGGIMDLTVFLVDEETDEIIARKSFEYTGEATRQTINFLNLEPREYIVYAYANVKGNDWFSIPSESETSFVDYKDALLKPLSSGVPVVNNGRMPLTGKQEITVVNGNNSRTVQLIRPVGKLTVQIVNEGTEAVTAETPMLGNIFPTTGYVFKHDNILPENSNNPYLSIEYDNESHSIVPDSYHLVLESLMYEMYSEQGITISMTYKGADYTFQENLSGNLQNVKQETLLIKLYNPGNSSDDLFLRLNQTAGRYHLELVHVYELDEKCFWRLSSSGRQQRGLTNTYYDISLNMSDGLSFSNRVETFKYGGSRDYTTIGESSEQLCYDETTGEFYVGRDGTLFQFFTYVEDKNSGLIDTMPVRVQDIINDTTIPLKSISRNQHVQLNIVFR